MNANIRQPLGGVDAMAERPLAAKLEPFDSYWQAPKDIEKGFTSFTAYYKANYLSHMPQDKDARILVISCGPGYLVNMLKQHGYRNVLGIDSDPVKVEYGKRRGLPCEAARAFSYLEGRRGQYDVIIPEQELNHLTLDETIDFLKLARESLKPGGKIVVYAMNGANPFVGSENLSHNIDHFYLVTEYSLQQILELAGFQNVRVFPLALYVFWKNPANYVGLAITKTLELGARIVFKLYGKNVKVLSKKVAAAATAP
jgi:SAM-dependent methyltransferase